jgi:rhodanese-related sulfurtransferase
MEDITVRELKSKMESGAEVVLIDVREPHEHEAFNIGGRLIPLGQVPRTLSELSRHKEEEVVVYCRSGRRSATAQGLLQQAGFKNVRNLLGGVLAWQDAFGSDQR